MGPPAATCRQDQGGRTVTNKRLRSWLRLVCAAALALLVPCIALAQAGDCAQLFLAGQPPTLVDARLAQRTTLLCNDAYAALASGVTHGPIWSAEHPTGASLAAARDTARQDRFHADRRLPFEDQAQLEDYRGSGFDRGHMTPSGDMPDPEAQQQSFSLANMVPQAAILNRGLWADIETAVRTLATRRGELYVVTGPAFQGANIQAIGANGVLVPTAVWKAVYDPKAGGAGVYVCRNTAAPTCAVVSVATLTSRVGIDPFPALSPRARRTAMTLPKPESGRYASRRQPTPRYRQPSLLDQMLGR